MNRKENFDSFIETIEELNTVLRDLVAWERDLTNLACENADSLIETHVKKIQPTLLKYRGLEFERESKLKELGFDGLNGKELLSVLTEEECNVYKPLYETLKGLCDEMKSEEEKCNRILNIRLNDLKLTLAKNDVLVKKSATDKYV